MVSRTVLSLLQFVEAHSPLAVREWRSITVDEPYPFFRSTDDLENGQICRPQELPFANPTAARNALHKSRLLDQIWLETCGEVQSGRWECHARHEDHVSLQAIPWQTLRRAKPALEAGTIYFLGELYEDVTFERLQSVSPDERAIQFIKAFCSDNDPRDTRVQDVVEAIRTQLVIVMTDGHVRKLMREANVDPAWSARGRKSAKKV